MSSFSPAKSLVMATNIISFITPHNNKSLLQAGFLPEAA